MAKKVRKEETYRTKRGNLLTEKDIDAIVDEIEHGPPPDPSTLKHIFVGRPSLSGSGDSPRVTFRITPELYLAAEERAEADDCSVSDVIRTALGEYLGRNPDPS
jgi:hypothetical protein